MNSTHNLTFGFLRRAASLNEEKKNCVKTSGEATAGRHLTETAELSLYDNNRTTISLKHERLDDCIIAAPGSKNMLFM